jgi:hypothetical protein
MKIKAIAGVMFGFMVAGVAAAQQPATPQLEAPYQCEIVYAPRNASCAVGTLAPKRKG